MSAQDSGKTVSLRVGKFIKVKAGTFEVMQIDKVEKTYVSQRDSDDELIMYNHLPSIVFLKPPEIGSFDIGDIVTLKEHSVRLRQVGDVPNPLTLYIYKNVHKEMEDGEQGSEAKPTTENESVQTPTVG